MTDECRIGEGAAVPIAQDGVTVTGAFTTNPCSGAPQPNGGCLFDPNAQGIDIMREVLLGDDGEPDGDVCTSTTRMGNDATAEDGVIDTYWDMVQWGVMPFSDDASPSIEGVTSSKTAVENKFFDFDGDGNNDRPSGSAWTLEAFQKAFWYFQNAAEITGIRLISYLM